VVQLKILSGKMAGTEMVARHFPFRVGRVPTAHLRIEDAGVWDEHITITAGANTGMELLVQPGALASINGENVRQATLRNGDIIEMGCVQLRFGLTPTRQKGLWAREAMVWLGLGCVCAMQIALIYWLLS
jgi:hypothetical protein